MRIDSTLTDTTATATGGTTLAPTRDEFLRLFVAQLEHQDPLDPSDPSDMVAQLAQLTNVEQTAGLGARLDALVAQEASSARAALLGLFGRNVDAGGDAIRVADGATDLPVVADLGRPAKNVTVVIRDASGAEVRRLELGPQPPGACRLLDGVDLPPGTYQLEVTAVDDAGGAIATRPVVRGVVGQIAFGDDGTQLKVGGLLVDPADIASVS